eukprot:COSAG02_NODE_37748_length_438_cov_0.613569_1_plen_82_part_00
MPRALWQALARSINQSGGVELAMAACSAHLPDSSVTVRSNELLPVASTQQRETTLLTCVDVALWLWSQEPAMVLVSNLAAP